MNKRLDTAIIVLLLIILIGIGISGCAKPSQKTEPNPDQAPNVNVYNGTLSQILGCMFAPNECQKLKNKQSQKEPHKDQSEYQDDITKEMTEMDEDISKDNK
jgi:hypothetical protein